MGEKIYFIDLEGGRFCRVRVYIKTAKGVVQDLVIQLERWINNRWSPVARYDCAHGALHIDILHRDGSKDKRFLGDSNLNQAVTRSIEDLKKSWKDYLRRTGYEQEEDQ